MQPPLKYPEFPARLRKVASTVQIFDSLRRKWLVLTPEEWVRQHIINYLIVEKQVPPGIISIEKEVALNGLKKRYDIVVFGLDLKPWLVVECKAPYIALTEDVAAQVMRYNLTLEAAYAMISNGISEIVFQGHSRISELPRYTR